MADEAAKGVIGGYGQPLIAADLLTVPALLKQQGYHTAYIGKWHLGFTIEGAGKSGGGKKKAKGEDNHMGAPLDAVTRDGPLTRAFDEFFGFHHAHTMKSVFENVRVTQIIEPADVLPALVKHPSAHIAGRAKAGQPFFICLALNSPHVPIVPSKEWQGKSGLGDYGDFVMETDWALNEVLGALDKAGIADNTLVIFTSDNRCSPAADVKSLETQGHFASTSTGHGLFAAVNYGEGKTTADINGYLAITQTLDGRIQLITSKDHYAFNLT